jgi:hypothetical protein
MNYCGILAGLVGNLANKKALTFFPEDYGKMQDAAAKT